MNPNTTPHLVSHQVLKALQQDAYEYAKTTRISHDVLADSQELVALIRIVNQLGGISSKVHSSDNLRIVRFIVNKIVKKRILQLDTSKDPIAEIHNLIAEYSTSGVEYWQDLPGKIVERLDHNKLASPHPLEEVILASAEKKVEEHQFLKNLQIAILEKKLLYSSIAKRLVEVLKLTCSSRQWKYGSRIALLLSICKLQFTPNSLPVTYPLSLILELENELLLWEKRNFKNQPEDYLSSPPRVSESKSFRNVAFVSKPETAKICYKNSFPPLISIIVLNRNGDFHLKNLFNSFLKTNSFEKVEFIIVDHNSSDQSIETLQSYQKDIPITLLEFRCNNSFSKGNNLAAKHARGRLLMFLNNDIIFIDDVLQKAWDNVLAAPQSLHGFKLFYPEVEKKNNDETRVTRGGIQHNGILFNEDSQYSFFRPYNCQEDPGPARPVAVTAAAVLCTKQSFLDVGGFDEGFNYGYEDVDLSLQYLRKYHNFMNLIPDVSLIHNESATQSNDSPVELRDRRLGNIDLLKTRHANFLKKQIYWDRLTGNFNLSDKRITVGFVVTQSGENAVAGDYFTALELGTALQTKYGWNITFLPRLGTDADWHDVSGIDILVVMLHGYDVSKIYTTDCARPLTVAWLRNWFSAWSSYSWFHDYDLYFCSSDISTRYIKDKYRYPVSTLRIATNPDSFGKAILRQEYDCDYCFIGSYAHANRDIETALNPANINGKFLLFGSGWEEHLTFHQYFRGPLSYAEVPSVFASTRIVVDDANHVTKQWGSVNSRVFDALAAGALVITNSKTASLDAFSGLLPVYKDSDELTELLNFFLANETERALLVRKLQEMVNNEHTYLVRAETFYSTLLPLTARPFRVSIKVPVPCDKEKQYWGDYHFAKDLQEALKSLGYSVRIDIIPDWYKHHTLDEVVIVLRGKSEYITDASHINILWNISSPECVEIEEYNRYDVIFVASKQYATQLAPMVKPPVHPLLQCTNPRRFYLDNRSDFETKLLFVGNSRKQRRTAVMAAVENSLPIEVCGREWEGIIPDNFIKTTYIKNEDLRQYYSSAEIVLNDHWETMKKNGFINNRIFDAGCCESVVLSDYSDELNDVFGDLVPSYKNRHEFLTATKLLLSNRELRIQISKQLKERIIKEHTFVHRAGKIDEIIQDIWNAKKLNTLEILQNQGAARKEGEIHPKAASAA